jgi:hypothetical protein
VVLVDAAALVNSMLYFSELQFHTLKGEQGL